MGISTQLSSNEVLKATAESISLTVNKDGAAATLSSCSYILYDSGGNVEASGSITPVGNVMAVSIPATIFTEIEDNCKIKWTFTVSAVAYVTNNLFDVVSSKIVNCVIDTDLKKRYPQLTQELWSTQTNFNTQIEEALSLVKTDIKNKGDRGRLLIDSEQIKPLIIERALEIIFRARSREINDLWWTLADTHDGQYNKKFQATQFVYDADGDTVIDQNRNWATIEMSR